MTSSRRALWLVTEREVREALRRRTTWLIAGVMLVASTAAMVVPEVIGGHKQTHYDVTVVQGSTALDAALRQAVASIDASLTLSAATGTADAIRRVQDGTADVAVVAGARPRILVKAGEHDQLVAAANQALATESATSRLSAAGLSAAAISAVLHAPPVRITEVDPGSADRRAAAFALSLVMYVLLLMLLMQVANGTAVEKANRISEVLLGIVRPIPLLFGKVLGVTVVGVLVVAAGVTPVLVKLGIGGDLPAGLGAALVGGGAWFLLGIGLYLVLAGALGAMADRQEEVGSLVTPLNLVLIASYIVGATPDSAAARVLAYVPLTSPMVMPGRIAVGAASGIEMAVSLALSVVAVLLAARFGAVVYARAIVRTGRKLRLREVLRGV